MTEQTYTKEELDAAVRAQAFEQMILSKFHEMGMLISAAETSHAQAIVHVTDRLDAMTVMIEGNAVERKKEHDKLRNEMKEDFATRLELDAAFDKLNTKIDTNWSKLVLIVGVVSTVVGVIGVVAQILIKVL